MIALQYKPEIKRSGSVQEKINMSGCENTERVDGKEGKEEAQITGAKVLEQMQRKVVYVVAAGAAGALLAV